MSGMDGLHLLDRLKAIDPAALVIIMTAFSSVDSAVAALRKGAYDYVTKPFVNEELVQTVKNAVAQRELSREIRALRLELNRHFSFSEIVGNSAPIREIFAVVEKVAATNASVLIEGESGTGKELVAKAIHFNSGRAALPFLAVNCGALPESLLESELFGHTRGAFTGAVCDKKGLFRSADGGTVFLDEIGEMPAALQVKLLRALQEHEVTPVGSSSPVRFDARIVSATNRRLAEEVEAGRFREDLFYRLNVIEIGIPPLRSRREDIPLLLRHFAAKTARGHNMPEKPVTLEAAAAIGAYHWPGNIRELENAVERAFILSGDEIDVGSLPPKVGRPATRGDAIDYAASTLEDVERRHILAVLHETKEDKAAAAKILGIDLSTLYRKIKRYDDGL